MTIALSAAMLGCTLALPEAVSFAAEGPAATAPVANPIEIETSGAPRAPATQVTLPAPTIQADAGEAEAPADPADPELICMAKVVRHEAANQPRVGQLAVAQVIMNRLRAPGFPKTVCGVVHQPGQFFNTNTYHPSRSDSLWQTAWEVSVDAHREESESVIGGALFYNGTRDASPFHARRKRAAVIGDHTFFH